MDGESETRNEFSILVWREKQYMPYALVVGGVKTLVISGTSFLSCINVSNV